VVSDVAMSGSESSGVHLERRRPTHVLLPCDRGCRLWREREREDTERKESSIRPNWSVVRVREPDCVGGL
jgi:hypothetical protein